MHLLNFYTLLACLLLAGCSGGSGSGNNDSNGTPAATDAARPNILLIVLDDLGYNDLGANGNPNTPTPNLDDFARQGIRYTRNYVDSSCTATRVALLTGRSPVESGFRPAHLRLSDDTITIASTLRDAGYHTEHIGKWHVGNSDEKDAPNLTGFDHWFGFLTQFNLRGPRPDESIYQHPTYLNPWLEGDDEPAMQYPGHLTDILTERAINFIQAHSDDDRPWFLNLWYYAPHAPIQPSDTFKSRYPNTEEGKYHALVDQLDFNVGNVLRTLDEVDLADNTLVIILSDNGGTNRFTDNNAPFYGAKTQFLEGSVRTPLLIRWKGKTNPNTVNNDIVSIYDIFPTLAEAANSPISDDLIGRNLFAAQLTPLPTLFWETSAYDSHQYGILSEGGRWRLVKDEKDNITLNDLDADSTGASNVSNQYPEVIQKLQDLYFDWRQQARIVKVNYQVNDGPTGAILTGKDILRSPGYSGYTFAITATPAPQIDNLNQVIVEQKDRWYIHYTQHNGLEINILGKTLSGPVLEENTCSEIVVASFHSFSLLYPTTNLININLYINKVLVDSFDELDPIPNFDGYANATYIGRDSNGEQVFNGILSRPIILNEQVINEASSKEIGKSISDLPSLCNDL